MNQTQIEWVKNPDGTQGYTWNPITGCLNHVNGLCKGGNFPCYAYRLATTRLRERYLANINVAPVELSTHPSAWAAAVNSKQLLQTLDPFYPRFWPERLSILGGKSPHSYLKRCGIFVCDMSDLFGIGVPEEWTEKVMWTIKHNPMHRFYLLTKQPQNLPQWSPFPPNAWVGVTATGQIMWNEALRKLTDIKAMVKYISMEPYLERIAPEYTLMLKSGINWLIIGAQTKPYKPPNVEWVQEIVEDADKAGIPVFLKDSLIPLFDTEGNGVFLYPEWAMNKDNFALRQEMPSG